MLSLLPTFIITTPAAAATTELTVTKYDPYGNIIATQTVTWEWMRDHLPVYGNGVTHYYMHGPTFDDSSYELLWDTIEMVNIDSRDYGAAMGTDLKDLCNLIAGGAGPGDTIQIKAIDNFSKWFDYDDIYFPEPEQGKLVITWYTKDAEETGDGYVDGGYTNGMRLILFAETLNPEGKHVFGDWDMHETLPASRWYYFNSGGYWPSSGGISVKVVSKINIYQPNLVSCDASGNAKDEFFPGETVYVKGMGLSAGTSYKLWIQDEPVLSSPLDALDRPSGSYVFNAANDPSPGQETVTTDGNGDFDPLPVWNSADTWGQYDIVADSQSSGTVGQYDTYIAGSTSPKDFIDSPGWKGFTVVAPPPPTAAFTANVTSGDAPLTIHFTDLSTNSPTEWAWDFDNNGTVDSYDQNPTHIYYTTGTYTVKLTATNSVGSDDEIKTGYITVTGSAQPAWDLNGDGVCNIGDVVIVGLHWLETGIEGWIPEDLNSDGVINIGDVVVLGLYWGETW